MGSLKICHLLTLIQYVEDFHALRYMLTSRQSPTFQHGVPDCASSLSSTPPQYEYPQLYGLTDHSLSNSAVCWIWIFISLTDANINVLDPRRATR